MNEGARDRCVVIMESDPSPGAGRISFMQSSKLDDDGGPLNDANEATIADLDRSTVGDAEMAAVLGTHGKKHNKTGDGSRKRRAERESVDERPRFRKPPDSLRLTAEKTARHKKKKHR